MLSFQADRVIKYLSDDRSECCEAFIAEDVDIIRTEVVNKIFQ